MFKSNKTLYFLSEVTIWYIAPLLFATAYVVHYSNPVSSGLAHLYTTTLLLSLALLFRILTSTIISNKNLALFISNAISTSIFFCLITYYALVIIGLESWHRVISYELIVSYSEQARDLCNAIGVSFHLMLSTFAFVYLLLISVFYLLHKRFYWELKIPKKNQILLIILITSTLFLVLDQLMRVVFFNAENEPIALTFSNSKKSQDSTHQSTQGVIISQELNALESKVSAEYTPSTAAIKRNLIIIVVDALRPDHMGIYGYQRNTTPYLSSLYQQKLVQKIESVRSSCSESACGLISLASSRYVHQLPKSPITIQQILKQHHYNIHMILGGDHTNFYGLREAYGKVDSYFDGSMAKKHRYMNDDRIVIEETKNLKTWDQTPTMFQFHLMSSHILGKKQEKYRIYQPIAHYNPLSDNKDQQKYINFYDNGVIQTDDVIKQLLSTLQEKGYLNNALVIITADHGEELGELNRYSHASNINEKAVTIPLLLISYPKNSMPIQQQRNFVSQVDIAPTILQSFNMSIPSTWSGAPIQSSKNIDFTYLMLTPELGLYDHRDPKNLMKYVVNINTGEQFAFNITADPYAKNNIYWRIPANTRDTWYKKLSAIKFQENK